MPVISVFFGITIRMYYVEHRPPHFHVEFQGRAWTCDFEGRPLVGDVAPRRAERMIRAWAVQHRAELEVNWLRIIAGETIRPIAPLE